MQTRIPDGYESILSVYDTQKAISLLKRLFEDRLGALLNLYRVSAPLFVESNSGLNDNLNGYERPVSFDILRSDATAQVVQSLAKWKRLALKRYCFFPGKGLYTDMDAIRRDEDELDNLHSIYVDQWDWEKVILPENRNLDYLKLTVMDIVKALCDTQDTMQAIYPQLQRLGKLERKVTFITAQELEDMYPSAPTRRRRSCSRLQSGSVLRSSAIASSPARACIPIWTPSAATRMSLTISTPYTLTSGTGKRSYCPKTVILTISSSRSWISSRRCATLRIPCRLSTLSFSAWASWSARSPL